MPESSIPEIVKQYWNKFLAQCPPEQAAKYTSIPEAWGFGNTPKMADQLGSLVLQGIKTATCGAVWEYEMDGDPIPKIGELSIILDGKDMPMCIIETTEIRIIPFNEVDAQFAYEEGEDDRTLESWRREHWKFFQSVDPQGEHMSETMPLVCERFRMIWQE